MAKCVIFGTTTAALAHVAAGVRKRTHEGEVKLKLTFQQG